MNGNRYFLDTNAIIALLQGNESIKKILSTADWNGTSVISVLKFLAFPDLSSKDKLLFFNFIIRIELIGIKSDNLDLLES